MAAAAAAAAVADAEGDDVEWVEEEER